MADAKVEVPPRKYECVYCWRETTAEEYHKHRNDFAGHRFCSDLCAETYTGASGEEYENGQTN